MADPTSVADIILKNAFENAKKDVLWELTPKKDGKLPRIDINLEEGQYRIGIRAYDKNDTPTATLTDLFFKDEVWTRTKKMLEAEAKQAEIPGTEQTKQPKVIEEARQRLDRMREIQDKKWKKENIVGSEHWMFESLQFMRTDIGNAYNQARMQLSGQQHTPPPYDLNDVRKELQRQGIYKGGADLLYHPELPKNKGTQKKRGDVEAPDPTPKKAMSEQGTSDIQLSSAQGDAIAVPNRIPNLSPDKSIV